MRAAVLAVMLLTVPCALVADPLTKHQLSAFVTPNSVVYSESRGTDVSGGIGLAWTAFWTHRVSTELLVAAEQSYESASMTVPSAGGSITKIIQAHVDTYPVDALVQYHFLNQSKWQPYAGGGLRYVSKPSSELLPTESRTSFELNGGVVWQFAPRWGLKFDFKQLLREDSFYDHSMKGSVGFSWSY